MLPAQKTDICLMKVQEELTNQEIAERMNLSVNTVKTHYSEALKLLRIHLSKMLIIVAFFHTNDFLSVHLIKMKKMNRPTDKQIEEVLAGLPPRKMQNMWRNGLPQKKGSTILNAAMTQEAEHLKAETAEICGP